MELSEDDFEPCDCCALGIARMVCWDDRRRCQNCIDDLEREWLRKQAISSSWLASSPAEAPKPLTQVVADPQLGFELDGSA